MLTKECFYKHTFNNEIYAYFTFMGNHYRKEIDFCGGQTKKMHVDAFIYIMKN